MKKSYLFFLFFLILLPLAVFFFYADNDNSENIRSSEAENVQVNELGNTEAELFSFEKCENKNTIKDKGDCFVELAKETLNLDFCKLSYHGFDIDNYNIGCVVSVGIKKGNYNVCEDVFSEEYELFPCYTMLAGKSCDLEICNRIRKDLIVNRDENARDHCISYQNLFCS